MSAWAAGEANRGDRATALVEDIFCDKIRGRSYREGKTVRRYVPRVRVGRSLSRPPRCRGRWHVFPAVNENTRCDNAWSRYMRRSASPLLIVN